MGAEFKIGDRIVIKDWDEMAMKYGVDAEGDINIGPSFTQEMGKFCGKTGTIIEMSFNDDIEIEFDDDELQETNNYVFSDDMFHKIGEREEVEEEEEEEEEFPSKKPQIKEEKRTKIYFDHERLIFELTEEQLNLFKKLDEHGLLESHWRSEDYEVVKP